MSRDKKTLLNESTVRRFMKLAEIGPMSDEFIKEAYLDEEDEDLSERVYDANVETFDTDDPEQKQKLQSILDAAANGWYKVLCMDRKWIENKTDGTAKMYVYVEWVAPYQEIASSKLRNL